MRVLTNYDFNGNEIQNAKIQNLATAPSSPSKGTVYFNTSVNRLFVYDGGKWVGADATDAVLTGDAIVTNLNESALKIDDDNLSSNVNNAIAKAHDTHTISTVTGLQTALDGKSNTGHTHSIANVTGLQTELDGKSATSHNHTLDGLSNTTITSITSGEILKWNGTSWVNNTLSEAGISAVGHTHSIANVTGLQTELDDKASFVHDHSISDVTGLQTALDGKALDSHTHTIADTTGLQSVLDGKSSTSHNHTLDSLSNTTITSISSGEILKWNGIAWVNSTLSEAGVAASSHSHTIANVTGLQTALDGKVDDSQVLTNVPMGAVFTDTITTIGGKTGEITKADITALGIPAENTTYTLFTTTVDGLTPKSDGSTTKYLRADGTWMTPSDTKYTLPVAGASIGGVKSGTDITVDASGNVSIVDDSHNHIISNIDGLQTALDSKETPAGASSKASTAELNAKSYTDTKLAELLDTAPDTLNTLNELASALGNDPNFATTITNEIGLKADKYSVAIGNGTGTSFTVTHNFNSRDVAVTIRETATPYAQVITDVEMTTLNTITVKFASAPASNQYTVTVIG